MYYEDKPQSREDIRFPYKGSELLEAAIRLRLAFRTAELMFRAQLSKLLEDPHVRRDSEEVRACEKGIDKNGRQYEACCVWAAGFRRQPDREFNLSIGDVVYFGLEESIESAQQLASPDLPTTVSYAYEEDPFV